MTKNQIFWNTLIAIVSAIIGGIAVLYYQDKVINPLSSESKRLRKEIASREDSLSNLKLKDAEYIKIQEEEIRLDQIVLQVKENISSKKFIKSRQLLGQINWTMELIYNSPDEYIVKYKKIKADLTKLYNNSYSYFQRINKKTLPVTVELEEYGKGIYTFSDGSRLVCKYVKDAYTEVDFYYSDPFESPVIKQEIRIGEEFVFISSEEIKYSVLYISRVDYSTAQFILKKY